MSDRRKRRARFWLALIGVSLLLPQLGTVVSTAHRAYAGSDAATEALAEKKEEAAGEEATKDEDVDSEKDLGEQVRDAINERYPGVLDAAEKAINEKGGGTLGDPGKDQEDSEGEGDKEARSFLSP